ncbi:protein FAM209-like [Myotis daubentonii]|uniref:protein FAM209-like n=1 Tax=Myotis daubentonii TaxID=98922 RepID=UPI00287395ED|nr:protein FAM209-like [Myotis daubentonii]
MPPAPYILLPGPGLTGLPAAITMARAAPGRGLCDINPAQPQHLESRCEGRQTHHEQPPPPALLTMRTLKWTLFLPICLSCGYAFMFSSLRENVKAPPGKVPCGGHFRIRQNLPEHAPGWLVSKWLWFFFIVILYLILKFRRDREKMKEKTPPSPRGSLVRAAPKKNQCADPSKDYALHTLNQLEMDLVQFMSKVRNLKVAVATAGDYKGQNFEGPADPHNNVTIYEIWGEEDYE